MPSILYGTRLAWLFGEPSKKQHRIYDDDIPVQAASNAPTFKETPSLVQPRPTSNKLLKGIWLVAGITTILMPLLVRNARLNDDQNNAWNMVANQYNKYQEQYAQNQQEGKRFYDVHNCKWYNFGCQPMYVDEAGNPVSEYEMQQEKYRQQMEKQEQYYQEQAEKQQQYYQQQAEKQQQYYQNQAYGQPSWYWGQTQEERNRAMENGEPSASLRFVYAWQTIMFVAILAYGFYVMHYQKSLAYLTGALVIWFQYNFLSMFLLSDGSIVTEERIMELTGFYGQFAVLIFITNAWYAVFGLFFSIYFIVRSKTCSPEEPTTTANSTHLEEDKITDYQAYKEPVDAPPSPTKSDISEEYVKVV